MSIIDPTIVDSQAVTPDGKGIALLISDHLTWESEQLHLQALQDKLNSYISYLRCAQFAQYFPDMEFTYAVIDIHFLHGITPKCQQFLKAVQQSVGEFGIQIYVSLTKPLEESVRN